MSRKAKIASFLIFLIFFVGFIFSSWTLAFINLPAGYHYTIIYYEGDVPKNLTLIIPIPYINGKPAIKEVESFPGNVSVIKTRYGEMLKVETQNADWVTVAGFISNERTIDVVNSNITLLPVLERKLISKTENDKGVSIVHKIRVPVYAEFEGNSTILVRFDVRSGFKALPFFFIYTIPWEPRYGWKPYAGHKIIEFKIEKKGWQIVEGEERVGIIYQRLW